MVFCPKKHVKHVQKTGQNTKRFNQLNWFNNFVLIKTSFRPTFYPRRNKTVWVH
jgi:hypothetical protein